MNIVIDIVLPPIIVAMLIGMIFGVNSLIMRSSIENRLMYELQGFANNSLLVIQEEVRNLRDVEELTASTVRFISIEDDTISIFRNGRNLVVTRSNAAGTPSDTLTYPARLSELTFSPTLPELLASPLLHVQVVTESLPEQEAGEQDFRYMGVAEKEIYLRTLHLANP